MKNKRLIYIVVGILLVGIAALFYINYFLIPKNGGGGIVATATKPIGKIKPLFSIYGPGKGNAAKFRRPMSVATDKDENIYVTDTGNQRVVVFNRKGEFMFEFGGLGFAKPVPGVKATWKPGLFEYPYGIDIDKETGNIFVADMTNQRIQIFDSKGKFLDWFPKERYGGTAGDIYPTDIAVEGGKVYICNPYQVVIFDTKGKFIKDFGMPGSGEDGKFDRPNGIDVGKDGTIYVSDSNNLRVQAFTPEGKFKWAYGKKTGFNDNKGRVMGLPRNLAVGPDGNIYVVDAFHFNIKVFDPQGKKVAAMGKRGLADGYFNYPNGIEVTDKGRVYVVDKENNRVQALSLTGFEIDEEEDANSGQNMPGQMMKL
ncbi:MAG TPA: 6-bladed beta-propeller [Bacillota bacterium]|nr:6-bladed beta-propeller [Bacillota bacterium]